MKPIPFIVAILSMLLGGSATRAAGAGAATAIITQVQMTDPSAPSAAIVLSPSIHPVANVAPAQSRMATTTDLNLTRMEVAPAAKLTVTPQLKRKGMGLKFKLKF